MAALPEHGFAAGLFTEKIEAWLIRMGLEDSVKLRIGSGVPAVDGSIHETRVPNLSFGPNWPPLGFPTDRPSVTIEVGSSQSLPSLEDTADWWLAPERGGVLACITCKLYKSQRLVIDVWQRRQSDRGTSVSIIKQCHIVICRKKIIPRRMSPRTKRRTARNNSAPEYEIVVYGGPMILKFHHFMRRLPSPHTTRECDLEIDDETLKKMAIDIWEEQGL